MVRILRIPLLIFVCLENKRGAMVTKPLTGRRWPVIENMAVMSAADSAMVFGTRAE